jgi:hypothetical protein
LIVGDAAISLKAANVDNSLSYVEIHTFLRTTFGLEESLVDIKQKPGESSTIFGARISIAVRTKYEKLHLNNHKVIEHDSLEIFCTNSRPEVIARLNALPMPPNSFQQAVSIGTRLDRAQRTVDNNASRYSLAAITSGGEPNKSDWANQIKNIHIRLNNKQDKATVSVNTAAHEQVNEKSNVTKAPSSSCPGFRQSENNRIQEEVGISKSFDQEARHIRSNQQQWGWSSLSLIDVCPIHEQEQRHVEKERSSSDGDRAQPRMNTNCLFIVFFSCFS